MNDSSRNADKPATEMDPLGRLAEEFLSRLRRGERPSLTPYTELHPELAARIREVFPLLAMMERLGPAEETGLGGPGGRGPETRADQKPPECLGAYRILREVGRGGMGIVYEAEQTTLGRRVALKVLQPSWPSASGYLERFQREARAAALLHHTNLVPVFDVGEQDDVAYYAMQFINGCGLDDVLDELRRLRPAPGKDRPPAADESTPACPSPPASATDLARTLSMGITPHARCRSEEPAGHSSAPITRGEAETSQALSSSAPDSAAHAGHPDVSTLSESGAHYWRSVARIGVQVAEALQYAHQHGTLHRDIKPSNLLLDLSGAVWVTDFGLARIEDEDDLTHTGEFVGTLRYMAPERFGGHSDARSDIYGLGLTLYELLTLAPASADSPGFARRAAEAAPARSRHSPGPGDDRFEGD